MKTNKAPKIILLLTILLLFTVSAYAQSCPEGTQRELFAGSRPNGKVFSYVDETWSTSLDSPEEMFWSLGYFSLNNKVYAGDANEADIMDARIYEYDGCEWKVVYNTGEIDVKAFEEFNGRLYASTGKRGKVFVTSNGKDWQEAFDPNDVNDKYGYTLKVFKGKLYYGTGYNGGTIYVTSNGIDWNVAKSLTTGSFHVHTLEEYNGKLYAG